MHTQCCGFIRGTHQHQCVQVTEILPKRTSHQRLKLDFKFSIHRSGTRGHPTHANSNTTTNANLNSLKYPRRHLHTAPLPVMLRLFSWTVLVPLLWIIWKAVSSTHDVAAHHCWEDVLLLLSSHRWAVKLHKNYAIITPCTPFWSVHRYCGIILGLPWLPFITSLHNNPALSQCLHVAMLCPSKENDTAFQTLLKDKEWSQILQISAFTCRDLR